ncbi:MAG: polyhydroxyalkanoate depolymerase [Micavibrio sp.]|nr:polyhydroxyalkanoate depolymerase [Micavibrio sp.]
MLYHMHDLFNASLTPARTTAEAIKSFWDSPYMPEVLKPYGRSIAAGAEVFERATRKFGKPQFGLDHTTIDGKKVAVTEKTVKELPFCSLLNFSRKTDRKDPKVLVVAPISGHYATLLRGTVEALLPHHDVYITDWMDVRLVPLSEGKFNLDSFIEYLINFIRELGPDIHVIAVCQPAPAVLATTALLAGWDDKNQPLSITLMGGPIDPRISKTAVTEIAEQKPLSWFERNVITSVPWYYPGSGRSVYPGFIQLGGFMSMNLDLHMGSSLQFYQHLVQGDGESADKHRKFYDEYMAVMDLPAEFYLQTVKEIFQTYALPRGVMKWRDPETDKLHDVDTTKIKKTAILTIEGEKDDISALGQTLAAHDITPNLPANKHFHYMQKDVGHYGIFNGSRWRKHIMPRVRHFIRSQDPKKAVVPAADLKPTGNPAPEKWDHDRHFTEAMRAYKKQFPDKA